MNASRSRQDEGRRGSITLETIVGLSLLLAVFVAMVHLISGVWIQMRLEDEAMMLVRQAARLERPAGTVEAGVVPGTDRQARIAWMNHRVDVQVATADGRLAATRSFPVGGGQ